MVEQRARSGRAVLLYVAFALGFSVAYWLLLYLDRRSILALDGVQGLLGAARGHFYKKRVTASVVALARECTRGGSGYVYIAICITPNRFSCLIACCSD